MMTPPVISPSLLSLSTLEVASTEPWPERKIIFTRRGGPEITELTGGGATLPFTGAGTGGSEAGMFLKTRLSSQTPLHIYYNVILMMFYGN